MEVRLSEGEGFELSFSASSRQFCLCGGLSESTKFNIVPTVVGEIDIEATVSIFFFQILQKTRIELSQIMEFFSQLTLKHQAKL